MAEDMVEDVRDEGGGRRGEGMKGGKEGNSGVETTPGIMERQLLEFSSSNASVSWFD